MEVIILAGGLGTRLRSAIGNDVPKCMAEVNGEPFLYYQLEYLRKFNVKRVVLAVGHLREVIFEWVNKIKGNYPFEIVFSVEENPLGTGGGIKLATNECKENDPIVINGDTYFDVDLDAFLKWHQSRPSSISLVLKPMNHFDRYGRVNIDEETNRIKEFCEKQPCEKGLINGGVYAISRASMNWPNADKFSFEKDVLEAQVNRDCIFGFEQNGYFIDIGIPEDYERFGKDVRKQDR